MFFGLRPFAVLQGLQYKARCCSASPSVEGPLLCCISSGFPPSAVLQLPQSEPSAALQVYKRSFWTESFVQWSPKGSYVTTVHTRGVAVWGGPSFGRIQRFSHNQVCLVLP